MTDIQSKIPCIANIIVKAVAATLVSVCVILTVSAQEMDDWYKHIFTPDLTDSKLKIMLENIPDLSSDQLVIIESLRADFIESFNIKSVDYRHEYTASMKRNQLQRDGRRRFLRNERRDQTSTYDATIQLTWRAAKPAIENEFAVEVGFVLNNKQLVIWQSEIRSLRRYKYLNTTDQQKFGFYVDSICDFISIVENLELPENSYLQIKPILNEFETEIEQVLFDMDIIGSAMHLEKELAEIADPDRVDPKTEEIRQANFEYGKKQRKQIAEIGYRYFDLIKANLPPESTDHFTNACGITMWPRLYRPSTTDMAFKRLKELDTLKQNKVTAIESISERYHRLRIPVYERIALQDREFKLNPPRDEEWKDLNAARMEIEEEARANPGVYLVWSPPGAEDWRQRHLLNLRTCRQLKALFTDEEFENLSADIRLLLSL